MADLTQSLYDAEQQLKGMGILARMANGHGADPKVVARLQGDEPSEWNKDLRRRFIRRLTVALATYGSSTTRTEYLIESVANRLNVEIEIAVLHSLVLLRFPRTDTDAASNACKEELHMLKVEGEVDVDKLQRIDELANSVGLSETPVMMGQWQLQTIMNSPPSFGAWYWQLLGFVLSAVTASLTFFDGNYWDAFFSSFLGLVVGILDLLVPSFPVFGIVAEFAAALAVSFLARLFSHYFSHLGVCFFAMSISGLVWLLPGQDLTLGVSEVLEGSVITGSAHIAKALVSSLQLGFGLMIGEELAWWLPKLEAKECDGPNLSTWILVVWAFGFVFSMNVLLRARWRQWFGMTVVSIAGYIAYELSQDSLGTETATVVSSFAIGLTATTCSFVVRDIPLSMVMAGIQVLLPGGIGVQGVDILMKDDVMSGISFMMNMVTVCLSITVGLLLAKVFLHDGVFVASKKLSNNHEDTESEEETVKGNQHETDAHMAI